ncbi:SCO family protein [Candidatus Uabimicrobium sp. HlEnr_7]|uniref:SCO family protein n=1 Tax=Candidatus Uabimicrobium helgolandensis TaxID=3095367 RepID=UPI0035579909
MKTKSLFLSFFGIFIIFCCQTFAKETTIGIEEQLGKNVPLDLEFTDENGKKITLKELCDKPVVLALVYFRCPGICTPLLNELQTVIDKVDLDPLKDFRVITVSIDPKETSQTANEKRTNYINLMKRKENFPKDSWRFLVGNQENINKLANAVGFRYVPEGNEFRHAGALTILSPEGKIVRYLFGLRYLPFDLKMAVVEASEGRVGPTIAKVLKLCFSYDPKNKKYVLNIVRISGVVSIFFVSIIAGFILLSRKKIVPEPINQEA